VLVRQGSYWSGRYFTPKEPLGPVGLDRWILDTGGEIAHQTVVTIVVTMLIGLLSWLSCKSFWILNEHKPIAECNAADTEQKRRSQESPDGDFKDGYQLEHTVSAGRRHRGRETVLRRRGGKQRQQHGGTAQTAEHIDLTQASLLWSRPQEEDEGKEEGKEEEEEKLGSSKVCEADTSSTRWIRVTDRRQQLLRDMQRKLCVPTADSVGASKKDESPTVHSRSLQHLGTRYCPDMLTVFTEIVNAIANQDEEDDANYTQRFDHLWAFTWTIMQHDDWL
jgi:hypothetical protein